MLVLVKQAFFITSKAKNSRIPVLLSSLPTSDEYSDLVTKALTPTFVYSFLSVGTISRVPRCGVGKKFC